MLLKSVDRHLQAWRAAEVVAASLLFYKLRSTSKSISRSVGFDTLQYD